MDYRIEDLPESERPREKLSEKGVSALSKVELLSIIIRTGIKGKNVKELSAEILESYGLSELSETPLRELEKIRGVSEVKSGQLVALGELARRMQREEREKLESLSDVMDRVRDMRFMKEEALRVFHLSSGNELLSEQEIEGSVDSAELDAREIFQESVNCGAAALILAHNHPSGRAEPTRQDIETTQKFMRTAEELGLELLDHVIVGDGVASMRRRGDLEPTSE